MKKRKKGKQTPFFEAIKNLSRMKLFLPDV